MCGLKNLLKNCLVKVWFSLDEFFARLFDLNYDRDNNENNHNERCDPDYGPTGVGKLVQKVSLSFLCMKEIKVTLFQFLLQKSIENLDLKLQYSFEHSITL